ncbi:MAG: glycosyltransferase family 2 protein [Planctomyces sp.]|nr:glycosyltransferase family 2 protein [Planctomyces sp.]
MASSLSVLIPTAGDRPDLLARSLRSLCECERPAGYHETVVVENGGRHGIEEAIRPFADTLHVRHLFDPWGNKSNALNRALASMRDGLIVLLDDDVRLSKDCLREYARAADGSESGFFFGGPTEVDFEAPPPHWLVGCLPASARGWRLGARESLGDRCFLGFNWAAFLSDLTEAGGFDPQRGPGAAFPGQETEMQQRLRTRGVRARYVPGALVWHYVPRERCTPEWVLKRHYRRSLSNAALMPPGLRKHCVTLVKASGRRLAAGLFRCAALFGSAPMAFRADLQRTIADGLLAGLRTAPLSASETPLANFEGAEDSYWPARPGKAA